MKCYVKLMIVMAMLMMLSACATKSQDKPQPVLPVAAQPATPFEQLSFKATRKTVYEDSGRFIMIEGSECTQRNGGTDAATMLLWVSMPYYVDSGTVVLNGWDLRYLHDDREIHSLRAEITHSKLVTGNDASFLVFEAQGHLSDQNHNTAYEFCIHYTGFGYHAAWFDAAIEGDHSGIDSQTLQSKHQGAVASLESIWSKGVFKSKDSVAVMPRGFGFQYDNRFECELRFPPCKWGDRSDYPLLQIAYNLFQISPSSNLNDNPRWITQTILKDNSTQDHWIKTRASLIGGSSIRLRTDLLPLTPRSGSTKTCRNGPDGIVHTRSVRLHDLPYDYAIPMLTGWDLSYECDDQRVQRAGIWIHDIHFDPASSELEYKISTVLRDKDGIPSFNAAHRVTVLGLNRLSAPSRRPLSIQENGPDKN